MPDCPFHAQIGPYWLSLPEGAQLSSDVDTPPTIGSYRIVHTHWLARLGRFRLSIRLDPLNDLDDLKRFIDLSTKGDVTTLPISVHGIPGVTYGGYSSPVTWIDWWLRKGDTMICLNLQGTPFPFKEEPTKAEVAEHQAIVGSLTYCRDAPSGPSI
jgi:hypothetical protein